MMQVVDGVSVEGHEDAGVDAELPQSPQGMESLVSTVVSVCSIQ